MNVVCTYSEYWVWEFIFASKEVKREKVLKTPKYESFKNTEPTIHYPCVDYRWQMYNPGLASSYHPAFFWANLSRSPFVRSAHSAKASSALTSIATWGKRCLHWQKFNPESPTTALKIPLGKRGKRMSALEDAVLLVLSPWHLSLRTGFWGWGGTGNVPPLTLCPITAKEGLDSPSPALLRLGDNKSRQSTLSAPATVPWKRQCLFWKQLENHCCGPSCICTLTEIKRNDKEKKMNKTCLLLVYLR